MRSKNFNEVINKIKNLEFQIGRFDGDFFWYTHLIFKKIGSLQKRFFGSSVPFIIIYQNKLYYFLLPTIKLLDFGRQIYNIYNFKNIKKEFDLLYEKAMDSFNLLINENDLQGSVYKNFINNVQKFTAFSVNSLEALENYLNYKLNAKIRDQKIKDLLITPLYESYIFKQQKDLIKIIKDLPQKELNELKKGRVTPIFIEKISEHLSKWKWVKLNYLSHSYPTKKVFIKQTLELVRNLNKEVAKIKKLEKRKKKKLLYLKRIDSELRKLINYIDTLYELKDRRKEFYIKTTVPFKIWLKKIGKKYNFSYEEFRWMTFEEQIKVSKKRYSSSKIKNHIKNRKKCTILFFGISNKEYFLIEGEKALKFKQCLLLRQKESILKGIPAFSGYVVGTSAVIKSKKEIKNFKEGNILVSPHTTPDFVPVMKKAAAILTERGGLTSHAAIVSRELGTPCIVGIVGLLGNIKTGDYLEVDATKGIVRKLTKKEYEKKIKDLEKEERKIEVSRIPRKTIEIELKPDLIAWFESINKKDILLVGGKGANLGEMFNKFPIPNGFCVTVNAYKKFLKENNLESKIFPLLAKLDIENTKELEKASKTIQSLIIKAKIPNDVKEEIVSSYRKLKEKFIAVRSSATAEDLPTASFAGQQATFLNVKGEKSLIEAVKKCWASLFTARAIYYRVVNNFKHEKVLIAVVVQEMINAEKAGVMFSANPVSRDKNEVIIEASFGLGEAVVSGQVNPDCYIVDKKSLKIKEMKINEKGRAIVRNKSGKNQTIKLTKSKSNSQCLTDKEVKEIAKLAIKIEKHYKKPQDIEWTIDKKGKVYILQSRAITTL